MLGKDGQLDQDTKSYHSAMEVYLEHAEHQWRLASRLIQFWRGKLPSQLDGTFSKIMLNVGYAMAQERIPKFLDNLVGGDKIFTLTAENPVAEFLSDQAESWLNHEYLDESRINIRSSIWATLQSVVTAGTGFRMPYVTHSKDEKGTWQPLLCNRDVDFFQILPAPNSGIVNPMDRYSDDALDGFFFFDWWSDDQIKMLSRYKGYQKADAEACLASHPDSHGEMQNEYVDKYQVLAGVSLGQGSSDWRRRMQDVGATPGKKNGPMGRRRVAVWFKRDGMEIYAQDYFKLYKGPNPMPNRLLPLEVWKAIPDFNNLYGISDLEMNEDILHAFLMNFNFRMDYLTQVMFPAKWIRADVMQGRSPSEFDYTQNAVHEFPQTNARFDDMIHYDRMPEITPQTFMEEDRIKMVLQMVSGVSNYSRGMPSQGTIENRTATGITELIQQAAGRQTAESLALEEFGLRQGGRLMLALGEKHIHRDLFIRLGRNEGGFQWTTIEAEALADQYTVHTHGTRHMSNREQQFQKYMALYPLFSQRPNVDQQKLDEGLANAAGIDNVDELLPAPEIGIAGAAGAEGGLSGPAATQDISQRTRGMQNRNTVQAGGNKQLPANAAF